MAEQTPSVGRVVHYLSRGSADGVYAPACRAATIVEVGGWITTRDEDTWTDENGTKWREVHQRWSDDACTLKIETPEGEFRNLCAHDPLGQARGAWHWPERV